MKHILVPIGSTENAQNTLQYAIDFATEINAKVFVFRAYSSYTKAGTIINVDAIARAIIPFLSQVSAFLFSIF